MITTSLFNNLNLATMRRHFCYLLVLSIQLGTLLHYNMNWTWTGLIVTLHVVQRLHRQPCVQYV